MSTQTLLFAELAPEPTLAFPEPLSERYRPQRIADFAGLSEVKRVLTGFAAKPTNAGFVFLGSPGTGKTSMGLALAREVGGFVHHIRAGRCTVDAIRDVAYSCWYVAPKGYSRHVVIVDEAHKMSEAAQMELLSYLDGTETIPDTVWVFTCTDTERLSEAFLSRNKVLSFTTYGIQSDAAALLENVWTKEAQADQPAPNFARIIKETTGNVRAALMQIEMRLYPA